MSLTPEELEQFPARYRWLLKLFLKLPTPRLPYFVLKRFPEMEGMFWAVGVPVFLVAYFLFSVWFVSFLSEHVIFPFNLTLGLLIPAIIFVFFARIQLERTLLWWKNIRNQSPEWNVSKVVEELTALFREQRRKTKRGTA